jgi:hypothetical protein
VISLIVLELDAQLGDARLQFLGAEAADEALALQRVEHVLTQLGGRRHTHRVPRALRIADAGEHVTQWIGH